MIFERILKHFQFKFKDRTSAAIALSEILMNTIKISERKEVLTLAIPRGGVITADTISKRLLIDNFDIVMSKKLTDPNNEEQAIGAVITEGFVFIIEEFIKDFNITKEYVAEETTRQLTQINKRKRKYFQNEHNYPLYQKLIDNQIILVIDDGVATGATLSVTVKWIIQLCTKLNCNQKRIIVASPVIPKEIIERLREDFPIEVISVFSPLNRLFRSVQQYYSNFEQITDEQVLEILFLRKVNW